MVLIWIFGGDDETFQFESNSKLINNESYNNNASGCFICGSNITLDGNKFYNNGTNGLRILRWINGDSTYAHNIIITNNLIENNNKNLNEKGSSLTHNFVSEYLENSLFANNIIKWSVENSTQEFNFGVFNSRNIYVTNLICSTVNENLTTVFGQGCQIINSIDNKKSISIFSSLKTSKINITDLIFDKQFIYRPGNTLPDLENYQLAYATNGYGTYYLIFKTQNDGLKFIQLNDAN